MENNATSNSSVVARVFVAAVRCLPIRCLATTGGILIQIQRLMQGIYELRRETEKTSVIKFGIGIRKVNKGDIQMHGQNGVQKSILVLSFLFPKISVIG
jgi:hypothetical protein